MAPDVARPRVIAAIRRPDSRLADWVLPRLPDADVPELDDDFLGALRTRAQQPASSATNRQIAMLARYGSAHVLKEVRAFYQASAGSLSAAERGNLLAYLLKHDESGSRSLIEQAVTNRPDDNALLESVTGYAYTSSVDVIVRRRLESSDPKVAGSAARILQEHGSSASRRLLEARLNRWRAEWTPQRDQLDPQTYIGSAQGELEVTLMWSLIEGQAWSVTSEEITRLVRACVSEQCRSQFVRR